MLGHPRLRRRHDGRGAAATAAGGDGPPERRPRVVVGCGELLLGHAAVVHRHQDRAAARGERVVVAVVPDGGG